MHEISLMSEMVTLLAASAQENNIREITRVKLVVGKMTMALPDALRLAFEVFKGEPPLSPQALLEIEERETLGKCQACGHSFSLVDNYLFVCPACESVRIDILSGRELYIDHFEGEEEPAS
ncbi:hydrogenase maturation nickel metallochaperone HypA [Paradesulfitobacterium aromaticivorans]